MTKWRDYLTGKDPVRHTVVGTLKILPECYSPQLQNHRDILVYLPPSYIGSRRRFPVIYMHDGQNLFDAATSYVGEWHADETLESLAVNDGLEAIAVGIPNAGVDRVHELSPFADHSSQGRGDAYLRFIVETVKPIIDADFRTLPERAHTSILGSSMGGLISLYAYFAFAETFGAAGIVSPALWFGAHAIYHYLADQSAPPGKLYVDVGTREYDNMVEDRHEATERSAVYLEEVRRLNALLLEKGYTPGESLLYVEDEGAVHREDAWARRLPDALRFLLR